MIPDSRSSGRAVKLIDRHAEQAQLMQLVEAVLNGESRALMVRGDPGVGKTALLDFLAGEAAGCRVLRVTGVQSEMELAFAGLHQLCAPVMSRSGLLPAAQHQALRVAFALSEGPPPDRFLVGLAVLGLLSEVAEEQPLLCLVDDQHWLDQASAHALGFAARRLAADPIGLVFSTRTPRDELAGIPEVVLPGLPTPDARILLESTLAGPLDIRVRDQILRETGGNPLALLELLRGLTRTQLAGGFGLPGAVSVSARIEESFARQLADLPPQTQRLLQLAAADPSGDADLVWRAAGQLGIPLQAATPAMNAGLAEISTSVSFRHPMLRSAAYRSASPSERKGAHLALVEATDPVADPDRRAWHRAQAADGPDEEVAADLERSASRAQARGGPGRRRGVLREGGAADRRPGAARRTAPGRRTGQSAGRGI